MSDDFSFPSSLCTDCGVDIIDIGEWYTVRPQVWEQAWPHQRQRQHWSLRKDGCLCIGCLENRIGRELTCCDFTEAMGVTRSMSERMISRLMRHTRGPLTECFRPLDHG